MKYKYLARNKKGETQNGTIAAETKEAAIDTLQKHDLVVVALEEEKKKSFLFRDLSFLSFITQKDVVIFCRQLAILVGSDVPLVQSLKSLASQIDNPALQKKVTEIANDVEGGTLLSKALAKHPKIFSSFYVNLIKSGESAGRLQSSLNFLANHLERDFYLKSKVKRAMIYPIFVIVLFILVTIAVLVFVVPGMTAFFEDQLDQELPLVTRIVIGTSDFFLDYGWILLILAVAVIGGVWSWVKKTAQGRLVFDRFKLKMPLFGKRVFEKTYLAHFTKNLSTLVKGGLPIIQALDISGRVIPNRVYQNIIFRARDEVAKGSSISSVLERSSEIPPIVSQMIKTGERTGRLDYVLDNLADFYQREVDNTVDNLTRLIEPILIVGLGLMVGFLMIAIIMPMYSVGSGF